MARVRIQLVSTPWASPTLPSIQTAALKAHLLRRFGAAVEVSAHSPLFAIPHALAGARFREFFAEYSVYGETLYFLVYARRFGLPKVGVDSIEAGVDALAGAPKGGPVDRDLLDRLDAATVAFVDDELVSNLDAQAINVVGFSANYDQVYASLFMMKRLIERAPEARLVFVLGGASASLPEVASLLARLELPVWGVVGEGEHKLERMVEELLALSAPDGAAIHGALAGKVPGVYHAAEPVNLFEIDRAFFAGQVGALSDLPLPDYADFFASLARNTGDGFASYRTAMSVLVEGSRGCFAHCDFCGLNYQWSGFRKKSAQAVVDEVLALTLRHNVVDVEFVDNVCDTWAEAFADGLLQRRVRVRGFMELRAHHPEAFWTKLSLSGIDRIQIGIEALSTALLRNMKKGTRVVQNVAAQKYLVELGVFSGSNLIGHHPASTVEDIEETRRIVEAVPHFGPFQLSRYRLSIGSPLYESLGPDARRGLKPFLGAPLSLELDPWLVGFWYLVPAELSLPPEVYEAWEDFRRWYLEWKERPETKAASLTVASHHPGVLLIADTRGGGYLEATLEGDVARVYDACHRPSNLRSLADELGLPRPRVQAILDELERRRWLLELDGAYLSIARRPRDVLIQNLYRNQPEPVRRSSARLPVVAD